MPIAQSHARHGRRQFLAGARAGLADTDYLNFLLNIEFLEAEFYILSVTGKPLSTYLGAFTPGTITAPPNPLVPFQIPAVGYWALRMANDHLAHVQFLIEAIAAGGGTVIAEPNIDLVDGFSAIALQAGLITGGTYNAFASEIDFLIGAFTLEDVGVTAYAGVAGLLTNPTVNGVTLFNTAYVASNLAVEAEHAGCVRAYLAQIGGGGITDAIAAARSILSTGMTGFDNGTDVVNGKGVVLSPYLFPNADSSGQVYRRTPAQVLNVLYGKPGTGAANGGFFPNGVQGSIQTT